MPVGPLKIGTRKLTAGIALAAFALRALVPAGFMLESGHPLTVIICPDGFPPQLLSQDGQGMPDMAGMPDMLGTTGGGHGDHRGGNQSHSDHCLFTSGSGHGPTPAFAAPVTSSHVFREVAVAPRQRLSDVRLVYVPQARAPPVLT
ncbi:MAG: hypothetical protein WBE92_07460 [Steroidobacteraceae bacterium]